MRQLIGAMFVTVLLLGGSARAADDKDPKALIDKAIKALGVDEKVGNAKATTWKAKGKINFDGTDKDSTVRTTMQGLDHCRQEYESDFNGLKIKVVFVLNGDKGWRQMNDGTTSMTMEMDKDAIANEKRTLYLMAIPGMLLPLKDKGFKVEAIPEGKVGGKPAAGIKVTGPDGKDFTLYFDKDSGLPVMQVAKVIGFGGGEEFTLESHFSDYKEFNGVKRATKVEHKRDGKPFSSVELTEFKTLDKVDPNTFAEPK